MKILRTGFFLSFLSLFSFSGCAVTEGHHLFACMPGGRLVSLSVSAQGTMMQPHYSYKVELSDSIVTCAYFDHSRNCYAINQVEASLLDSLRQVIERHKMYSYAESYHNPHVLDGDSWGFSAYFSDGKSISSHGSNAGPRNNGCSTLASLCKEALKHSTYISRCDSEGKIVPDVPDSLSEAKFEDIFFAWASPMGGGTPRTHFEITEENCRSAHKLFDIDSISTGYYNVVPMHTFDNCWGVKVLNDGGGADPMLYLILDEGYVERLSLHDLAHGGRKTTHRSEQSGLVDLHTIMVAGREHVVGIDAEGHDVELKWNECSSE